MGKLASSKILDTSDHTLICMADTRGDIHCHTFGEIWAQEMAERRDHEIWFFAELTTQ